MAPVRKVKFAGIAAAALALGVTALDAFAVDTSVGVGALVVGLGTSFVGWLTKEEA